MQEADCIESCLHKTVLFEIDSLPDLLRWLGWPDAHRFHRSTWTPRCSHVEPRKGHSPSLQWIQQGFRVFQPEALLGD